MNPSISRRRLLKGSAAAAAAVGFSRFTALSYGNIVGSNDAIHIGVIGFNGRGNSHIDAWTKLKGVRLIALCDADSKVLDAGYGRVMKKLNPPTTRPTTEPSKELSSAATQPAEKPQSVAKYGDLRKMLDNKELDAISTATPNHWHSLVTVWGCQAGKDVYVEKPVSHNVWEGRQSIAAARKYNRIVQAGTQSRSSPQLREAIEWLHAGNLGKILVAHGLCYKRRGTIGKVDEAPKPPETVNLDLWCGPSPLEAPKRKKFHYDWHWFWETGCGDIGNQGIHQMDIARWALGKKELSPSILSVGGRFGYDDDGQTPNTQIAIHNYGDALLIFEVRGLPHKPGSAKMDTYRGQGVGQVVKCEKGYLAGTTAYDLKGEVIKKFDGKNVGDGSGSSSVENRSEGDHFGNFIKACRSRKVSDLHADIEEGHLSSALCHTSNISHRLGAKSDPDEIKEAILADTAAQESSEKLREHLSDLRSVGGEFIEAMDSFYRFKEHLAVNEVEIESDKAALGVPLKMDPKTERFVDNEKANAMLKRIYRAPFVVPDNV